MSEAHDDESATFYDRLDGLSRGSASERIVAALWRDVTDRRGWRQAADNIDYAIRHEILDDWLEIVGEATSLLWRTIETAPKDGTHILLFERGRDDVMETGRWHIEAERWVINNNSFWVVEPSHWMPLADPPPPD